MIKSILPTLGASEPDRCIGPCWCGAGCEGHPDTYHNGYYGVMDVDFGMVQD